MFRRIGIALAAYQPDQNYLFDQLRSIQSQTFEDWICWVAFDSPLDEIKRFERFNVFFKDSRFHWSENPRKLGHLKNFEKAIQAVHALKVDAIACCDQDDIWFPEKLKRSINALNELGANGLVFSDMRLVDQAGVIGPRTAWQVERRGVSHCGTFDLLVRNVVPGTGMLMDASLVARFPEIPEAAVFHDHWYPLIASCIGHLKPIDQALYAYRIHGENVVGVTPFLGLFDPSTAKEGIVKKCVSVWKRSSELARQAERSGLPLSAFARHAFLAQWDLGVILMVRGLLCLGSDPALARACFARALGKLLTLSHIAKS
jgi:glycosyltransferase involved in cell wall biosynthesis